MCAQHSRSCSSKSGNINCSTQYRLSFKAKGQDIWLHTHSVQASAGACSLQVAASLNNTDLAKLAYTHNLDRTASVGAEVSKKVTDSAESPTKFQVGYAKRLQGGGLAKARLDNAGELLLLSALAATSAVWLCKSCRCMSRSLCLSSASD